MLMGNLEKSLEVLNKGIEKCEDKNNLNNLKN